MATRLLTSLIIVLCFAFSQSNAQTTSDPVLFSVNGDEVRLSEFQYIYEKTNGAKATYSKVSVNEYLDLYKKFKLKVQRAKELQLDTITTLQKELDGYKRQLADSYLIDKVILMYLFKKTFNSRVSIPGLKLS